MKRPSQERSKRRATVIKALAHPSRLAIAEALQEGERCVQDLTTLVGADMSTVSKHLTVMRSVGLLDIEKRGRLPEAVLRLLERLRDPAFNRILIVTLPETTPVHEAADLQEDLRRVRIEPFAWVINQSLLHSGSCDSLLQCREASEHRYLREVVEKHATRTAWLLWQPEEPTSPDALARLASSNLQPAIS